MILRKHKLLSQTSTTYLQQLKYGQITLVLHVKLNFTEHTKLLSENLKESFYDTDMLYTKKISLTKIFAGGMTTM